jgi:hypothetical protein
MRILKLTPLPDWKLRVETNDGHIGMFDVRPYLEYEAFEELKNIEEFKKVVNRGYFIEWDCGADLSADTIDARMIVEDTAHSSVSA